jgi:hypothetical protein
VADLSPPSSVQFKEYVKIYLHTPNTPSWRSAQLKYRKSFTLYNTVEVLTTYTKRWEDHVDRMGEDRWANILQNCEVTEVKLRGKGKRNLMI